MLNSIPLGTCSAFQTIKIFLYSSANTNDLAISSDNAFPKSFPQFPRRITLLQWKNRCELFLTFFPLEVGVECFNAKQLPFFAEFTAMNRQTPTQHWGWGTGSVFAAGCLLGLDASKQALAGSDGLTHPWLRWQPVWPSALVPGSSSAGTEPWLCHENWKVKTYGCDSGLVRVWAHLWWGIRWETEPLAHTLGFGTVCDWRETGVQRGILWQSDGWGRKKHLAALTSVVIVPVFSWLAWNDTFIIF